MLYGLRRPNKPNTYFGKKLSSIHLLNLITRRAKFEKIWITNVIPNKAKCEISIKIHTVIFLNRLFSINIEPNELKNQK